MVNGKAKGSSFERKICKLLSLWISDGASQDCFWRSALSGGRSTIGLKKGIALPRQAGDITSVSPEGHALTDHFFLELKHYKSLALRSFFLHGTGILASHWASTRTQSNGYNKIPLLIAKQNNVATVIVAPRGMLHRMIGKDIFDEVIRGTITKVDQVHCEVCLLDDVLAHAFKYKPPSKIKRTRLIK